jgi:hypothetical protein
MTVLLHKLVLCKNLFTHGASSWRCKNYTRTNKHAHAHAHTLTFCHRDGQVQAADFRREKKRKKRKKRRRRRRRREEENDDDYAGKREKFAIMII